MRTKWLVIVVAAAHCVAVGGFMLMQGCGTVGGPMVVSEPQEPVMPPELDTLETVETVPVVPLDLPEVPKARTWPEQTSTYIVGKGDTLSGIAARFGLSVAELVALNDIKNPNVIRAGRPLIIAGKLEERPKKPAARKKVAGPKPADAPEGAVTYVVKSGDTLSEIAAKYDVKTAELKKINGLSSDKILVGWKLVIPGAKQDELRIYPPVPAGAPGMEEPRQVAPEQDMEVPVFEMKNEPVSETVQENVQVEAEPDFSTMPSPVEGTAEPAGDIRIHVVEEGEDLYSVAMMWGVSVSRIKELNNLTDTTLEAGDRLKIPITE